MLAIVVALTACGSGDGDGDKAAIPTACQDVRKVFHDWVNADLETFEATGNLRIANAKVTETMTAGGASRQKINELIAKVNADRLLAEKKVARSSQLYQDFAPLYAACLELKGEGVPPACADELRQYPAVTAAHAKSARAQLALLKEVVALRTALVSGDQGAQNAAPRINAAREKLDATTRRWNKIVLPKFAEATRSCNKAIS